MRALVRDTRRRGRYGAWRLCGATGCGEFLGGGGRFYCSERCANRERARRQRYRDILRNLREPCRACGTRHGSDGDVWLPGPNRNRHAA